MLSNAQKIPLWLAILINLNVLVGGAFFIGAPALSLSAGAWAPSLWILCALLLVPITIIFTRLAELLPHSGGIYVYVKHTFGRLAGFVVGWIYFISCAAGNLVLIDAFSKQCFSFSTLAKAFSTVGFNELWLTTFLIIGCTALALRGVHMLAVLETVISIVGLLPFVVLGASFFLFGKFSHMPSLPVQSGWFLKNLPMVLFAFAGIELWTSMVHLVEGGAKTVTKIIYGSLFCITLLYAGGQVLLLTLPGLTGTDAAFTQMARMIGGLFSPAAAQWFGLAVFASILLRYLGGVYAVFCANNWLLHSMTQDLTGAARNFLPQLNAAKEPHWCILLQGLVTLALLFLTRSGGWILQVSVIGAVLSFAAAATVFAKLRGGEHKTLVALSYLTVLVMLLGLGVELWSAGLMALLPVVVVYGLGFALYWLDRLGV